MADIDVVQKKSGMGWLVWVVLAAVVVLAVVWMLRSRSDRPVGRTAAPPVWVTPNEPSAVS
jgi:hypothetical protein